MTKILVIEDEAPIRENIQEILALEDFQLQTASNGREGLQHLKDFTPDLIICDIMMPEMNGYDVLMEVRAHPETTLIPFIFLTAKTTLSDLRRGMNLGADDYLTKPFSTADLLNAIQARLGKQRAISDARQKDMDALRTNIIHAMPHEFRTPLNGILGYSALMMEDQEEVDVASMMKMSGRIYKAGMRLTHLIENYLLYAQIEIIKLQEDTLATMRRSQTSTPAALIDTAARQRAVDVGRDADLEIDATGAIVAVAEDSLTKIVGEIVDNALKFSQSGSKVHVSASVADNYYVVYVTDSGRGMSQEQIESVGAYMQFERILYEQQGMGLGLILSKRLAELYDGVLTIESEKGVGTRVTIALPLV